MVRISDRKHDAWDKAHEEVMKACMDAMIKVRYDTLMEAAEWFDDGYEYSAANNVARELRRMAEEVMGGKK